MYGMSSPYSDFIPDNWMTESISVKTLSSLREFHTHKKYFSSVDNVKLKKISKRKLDTKREKICCEYKQLSFA